jgi:hypothetical protein
MRDQIHRIPLSDALFDALKDELAYELLSPAERHPGSQ